MPFLTKETFQQLPPHDQTNVVNELFPKIPPAPWGNKANFDMDQDDKYQMFKDAFPKLVNKSLNELQKRYNDEMRREIEMKGGNPYAVPSLRNIEEEEPNVWNNHMYLVWLLFDRERYDNLEDHLKKIYDVQYLAGFDSEKKSQKAGNEPPAESDIIRKSTSKQKKSTAPKPDTALNKAIAKKSPALHPPKTVNNISQALKALASARNKSSKTDKSTHTSKTAINNPPPEKTRTTSDKVKEESWELLQETGPEVLEEEDLVCSETGGNSKQEDDNDEQYDDNEDDDDEDKNDDGMEEDEDDDE